MVNNPVPPLPKFRTNQWDLHSEVQNVPYRITERMKRDAQFEYLEKYAALHSSDEVRSYLPVSWQRPVSRQSRYHGRQCYTCLSHTQTHTVQKSSRHPPGSLSSANTGRTPNHILPRHACLVVPTRSYHPNGNPCPTAIITHTRPCTANNFTQEPKPHTPIHNQSRRQVSGHIHNACLQLPQPSALDPITLQYWPAPPWATRPTSSPFNVHACT